MEEEAASKELVGTEATRFRAVAARASYLSADRPDIQYSMKEVCRRMAKPVEGDCQKLAKPVEGDWQKLTRLGRCLKGSPRCVSSSTGGREPAVPRPGIVILTGRGAGPPIRVLLAAY